MSAATQSTSRPVTRLVGVSKGFGDVQALRHLDLEIPAGVVGVLGPNGAGKSTMFRVLLGLEEADSGTVELLGWPLPETALRARAEVGFMPEDDCLFPELNGSDQVVHAAGLCGMERVDAFSRAHKTLDLVGLRDVRYRDVASYSLGMRQRLRLAMALVHGPRLLLLDEPTAGLDPAGRAEMLGLVREIGDAGTSVLLSTHVLGDVEAVCDHVIVLSRGQLGFVGPMKRFRAGTVGSHLLVEVVGDAARLAETLQGHGVTVQRDGQRLRVVLSGTDVATLWQTAAEVGVGIRHLSPEQEDIAQAFVRHLRLDDPTRREGNTNRPESGV